MSGRRPLSIVADQDRAIQQSIAQVFPGTHHRFSSWQIKAKEQQHLGALLSMDAGFKYEYETCIRQSQTPNEFDSAWNVLLNKYDLNENVGEGNVQDSQKLGSLVYKEYILRWYPN